MWWKEGYEWFESRFVELIGKLPSIKHYLDENGDGDVSLEEVWEKTKLFVSSAETLIDGFVKMTPGQKQEAVAGLVKKAFPTMKDSAIYTMINIAVILFKIFKTSR
jgi:hypothetical protein